MSVSKKWVSNPQNVKATLAAYRDLQTLPTYATVATMLKTSFQNVCHILNAHMPEAELRALQAMRYSVAKTGTLNPMHGKTGEAHHNWIGLCEDGYGYLTCLHKDHRVFVHRLVMAQALGLEPQDLPLAMVVHHIDGNSRNNLLDNLALVTNKGHREVHFLQVKDTVGVMLKRSTLAAAMRSMT